MCGITGWFATRPPTADDISLLLRMITAIAHRGPDGSGTRLVEHAALGHTRLAIIDLEAGAQPLSDIADEFVITFNGEIYNYRELRAELLAFGQHLRTHTDTEVVLGVYRAWGIAGFTRLRGMFAFAIWDRVKCQGLLVRDRFGIKPLFVARQPGARLLFASEAKALLPALGNSRIDTTALHLLLNFRYLPDQRTLFEGIEQLTPGTILIWSPDGRERVMRLDAPTANDGEHLLTALRDSVRMHCVADVNVGAYLSGGIDSAAVVALARDFTLSPLRTFTLAVGDNPREAEYAQSTAALLGVPNMQGQLHRLPDLRRLVWHLEAPKVNAIQLLALAALARREVKVVLSGLGSDELFYGYQVFVWLRLILQPGKRLQSIAESLAPSILRMFDTCGIPIWSEPERALLALATRDLPRCYGLLRNLWDSPRMRCEIYGPRLLDADLPDAFDVLRSLWPDESDPLKAVARFEWERKMVNDLLWNEDRCSMAEGLEVRVPFVDMQVHSAAARLAPSDHMPCGRLKGALRDEFASLLPRAILDRPKSGFQLNAVALFEGPLRAALERWLSSERIAESGLFNPRFVMTCLNRRRSRTLRWHYFLLLLMLQTHIWLDLFEHGE